MAAQSLILNSRSQLTVELVDPNPLGLSSVVFVVAQYRKLVGRFANITRLISVPVARDTTSCVYGDPVPNYGSTTLSVSVSVSCSNNPSSASTSPDLGLIIGLAVGIPIAGILLAVTVVLISKSLKSKRTERMRKSIKEKDLEQMNAVQQL